MINRELLLKELTFKFARSGGAGGQHVNKVSSKVLLQWHISESMCLNEDEKTLISSVLSNRINKESVFQLECDTDRSQLKNKELAIERFFHIIQTALTPTKARKKTKIPYRKVLDRLDRKAKQAEKKNNRRWSGD
ncbi:Peptidyl-tRNA hydrolase ArfB [compost metagenome]|jgi:ribosome-associated protein|uniref:alternative ribosome rescue aminoacyl-tRNA hydrolase ArfB n=1 Tax=Sphingobacterium faecium TaxID=34087 RepID=UPI000D371A1A|nr:alternative ribosome rescue aminoacyl-tRNA hydrolase ArfB [Sphingobacterium faecium]MQP27186.1 aminoacyl-tRNA hydrolase [Sphingobacterium faecium]PTX07855.1 ribosome-associated protein [Sphingobacterium faecium]GEM65632.1 aminoacyl-tRNA hydrolase [Sphingobacterium faecium NBRC 15299]